MSSRTSSKLSRGTTPQSRPLHSFLRLKKPPLPLAALPLLCPLKTAFIFICLPLPRDPGFTLGVTPGVGASIHGSPLGGNREVGSPTRWTHQGPVPLVETRAALGPLVTQAPAQAPCSRDPLRTWDSSAPDRASPWPLGHPATISFHGRRHAGWASGPPPQPGPGRPPTGSRSGSAPVQHLGPGWPAPPSSDLLRGALGLDDSRGHAPLSL